MDNVGVVLGIVGLIGVWYFIKRKKDNKKRNISIFLAVVGIIMVGVFGEDTTNKETKGASEIKTESTVSSSESEADRIQKEKEKAQEDEKIKKENEEKARKQKEEEEAAKKLQEELAKKEAEKKDPSTYETGLTYDDLARNPDSHIGEKVKIYGKVVQVMESDKGYTQYRLAVNEDYDTIIYLEISEDQLDSRILEDDLITIYGESYGTVSYESTLGGTITIPAVVVNMFELN